MVVVMLMLMRIVMMRIGGVGARIHFARLMVMMMMMMMWMP